MVAHRDASRLCCCSFRLTAAALTDSPARKRCTASVNHRYARMCDGRAPSPHSAILSCDQLRASPTPQVSRGRRAASETSRPSSAHDGAAFFGSLPRKHTSNPSQRSLRTPRTPPRPPKHPICHIAILSVSMTKASSPPVALSKHIKTTTNLNCAAPAHRNRVIPRAVRPQSAPAASMNRNRALGAARARAAPQKWNGRATALAIVWRRVVSNDSAPTSFKAPPRRVCNTHFMEVTHNARVVAPATAQPK